MAPLVDSKLQYAKKESLPYLNCGVDTVVTGATGEDDENDDE